MDEDVLQTLVISVELERHSIQVVVPNLKDTIGKLDNIIESSEGNVEIIFQRE